MLSSTIACAAQAHYCYTLVDPAQLSFAMFSKGYPAPAAEAAPTASSAAPPAAAAAPPPDDADESSPRKKRVTLPRSEILVNPFEIYTIQESGMKAMHQLAKLALKETDKNKVKAVKLANQAVIDMVASVASARDRAGDV